MHAAISGGPKSAAGGDVISNICKVVVVCNFCPLGMSGICMSKKRPLPPGPTTTSLYINSPLAFSSSRVLNCLRFWRHVALFSVPGWAAATPAAHSGPPPPPPFLSSSTPFFIWVDRAGSPFLPVSTGRQSSSWVESETKWFLPGDQMTHCHSSAY